jgi:hypothetical protein
MDLSSHAFPSNSPISVPSPSHPPAHPLPAQHVHHLKYGEIAHTDFDANARQERNELNKHAEFERLDARARRAHRDRRYLLRRPRPLQYFRGDVLVRDNSERSSGRLE